MLLALVASNVLFSEVCQVPREYRSYYSFSAPSSATYWEAAQTGSFLSTVLCMVFGKKLKNVLEITQSQLFFDVSFEHEHDGRGDL
jgi:hypothetical protein